MIFTACITTNVRLNCIVIFLAVLFEFKFKWTNNLYNLMHRHKDTHKHTHEHITGCVIITFKMHDSIEKQQSSTKSKRRRLYTYKCHWVVCVCVCLIRYFYAIYLFSARLFVVCLPICWYSTVHLFEVDCVLLLFSIVVLGLLISLKLLDFHVNFISRNRRNPTNSDWMHMRSEQKTQETKWLYMNGETPYMICILYTCRYIYLHPTEWTQVTWRAK